MIGWPLDYDPVAWSTPNRSDWLRCSIPDAAAKTGIPAADIGKAGETLKRYKEKPVVVCCERGPRGRTALLALQDQGFKQVVNLKGGMRAWRAEHLPVATD